MHDVLLNKIAIIERCLVRVREEFVDEHDFKSNVTRQDSVILNLQRACEASIDIANFKIKQNNLAIPQSARDSFETIAQANIISGPLADKLKRMVGLRNIAIHNYQQLDLDIVVAVVKNHLVDFEEYCGVVIGASEE